MNDSFGAGGFNPNSTTAQGAGNETKKDGILPVCIRQLLLVDDEVKMFDLSYSMVNLVAIVRKIDYTSTKITYTLEDHTGRIEAYYWLEDENSQQPKVTTNAYARVIGSLRNNAENKTIIIYHAEEVEKINDRTTHLLEVLFCRFKAEQFAKGGVLPRNGQSMTAALGGGSSSAGAPMETTDDIAPNGLSGKNLLILQVVKNYDGPDQDNGISRQEVYEKVPKIPKTEVDAILEYMMSEGFIYSTICADNFKSVE
uniref:CSON006869 protein n=1 Tax=Culicoides sonorensis TaxID=179676 RepID=A0A336M0F2_CULSO